MEANLKQDPGTAQSAFVTTRKRSQAAEAPQSNSAPKQSMHVLSDRMLMAARLGGCW